MTAGRKVDSIKYGETKVDVRDDRIICNGVINK